MNNSSTLTFPPSLAPTLLSTGPPTETPSNFACQVREDDRLPFICYPKDLSAGYGLDERLKNRLGLNDPDNEYRLLPIFACTTDSFTDDTPNREQCGSFCAIQFVSEAGPETCSSCSLVGSDIVYDCRNLIADETPDGTTVDEMDALESCAARNAQGECGDFVHWSCSAQGLGFGCLNLNRPWLVQDPVFPFDSVLESQVSLYCANDMSGLHMSHCEQPKCGIFRQNPNAACFSCNVLSNNDTSPYDFAYNCDTFPNLTCPALNASGVCVELVYDEENNDNVRGISALDEHGSNDKGWTWTIRGLSPTSFNVLSDLFGVATRILFGLAFVSIYPLIMTWHVRYNRKPIHVRALASAPGDILQASSLFNLLTWSMPGLVMAILFVIADFSHTLADTDFDFVEMQVAGPPASVLKIPTTTAWRNLERPFETNGDPDIARTVATNVALDEGRLNDSRDQTALKDSFLSATSLILRGSSPFVDEAIRPWRETLSLGGIPFNTFYMPDNTPVAALSGEIPLDCASVDLTSVEQVVTGFPIFDQPIYNTALIPNCTFSSERSSEIFQPDFERVEILENVDFVAISPTLDGADTGDEIVLQKGNESFQVFSLDPEQKMLSRDRLDWKKGRVITNLFDRIAIGNVTINVGRVVLATGSGTTNGRTVYVLVSQIVGDCPDRPSGLHTPNVQCLALVSISCDTFEEDSASRFHEIYEPFLTSSECGLSRMSLVWGRNFVADATLASVVAGLYGMIRPRNYGEDRRNFDRLCILSALFLMGTLEERPRGETVVQAQVGVRYIFFMLFPVAVSLVLVLFAFYFKDRVIPFPKSAFEMMVLGKEEAAVPQRESRGSPFPEMPDDLVLTFFDASDGNEGSAGVGIVRASRKKLSAAFEECVEVPVSDDSEEEVNGDNERVGGAFKPSSDQANSSEV